MDYDMEYDATLFEGTNHPYYYKQIGLFKKQFKLYKIKQQIKSIEKEIKKLQDCNITYNKQINDTELNHLKYKEIKSDYTRTMTIKYDEEGPYELWSPIKFSSPCNAKTCCCKSSITNYRNKIEKNNNKIDKLTNELYILNKMGGVSYFSPTPPILKYKM